MVAPLPDNLKIIDMVEPDTAVREEPQGTGFQQESISSKKVEMPVNKGTNWSNPEFRKRVISALILAPIVLGTVATGGVLFYILVLLIAVLMMREWDGLVKHRLTKSWTGAGVLYVTLTCISFILLRDENMGGSLPLLLFLLATVWATDIGAYFAGRQIGGPKLAPRLSPSKTWAGLGGGMLSSAAIGASLAFFFAFPATAFEGMVIGAMLAVVGQIGDLFESWLKRQAGVKDSGNLIPGHGGILDRVDGLTFTAPLLLAIYYLFGNVPAVTVIP